MSTILGRSSASRHEQRPWAAGSSPWPLGLPEDLRRARIGSRVLAMAEEEGRRRGCTRIALTTLSVEAPEFYQKQGYDIAATIDCDPPGLTRYYMMKRLVPLRG